MMPSQAYLRKGEDNIYPEIFILHRSACHTSNNTIPNYLKVFSNNQLEIYSLRE